MCEAGGAESERGINLLFLSNYQCACWSHYLTPQKMTRRTSVACSRQSCHAPTSDMMDKPTLASRQQSHYACFR